MTSLAYVITRRSAADNWSNTRRDTTGTLWRPDVVTIHVTEGDEEGTRSWFANKKSDVSSHYHVDQEGTIDQFVDEDDVAFVNGVVDRPSAAIVRERPGVNPNYYTIGIEHEGRGDRDLTDAQRAASQWLVRGICARWGIPVTRRHIIGHREIRMSKPCPGKIDVDRYVRELAATVPASAQPSPASAPAPRVVYSPHLRDYLVVTRVVSDEEWYYVSARELGAMPAQRAGAPLSAMPDGPP